MFYATASDNGRIHESQAHPRGMSPSLMLSDQILVDWQNKNTSLPLLEQLYTARGSQGLGGPYDHLQHFSIDPNKYPTPEGNPYSTFLVNMYGGI